jgi:hypothetical protein
MPVAGHYFAADADSHDELVRLRLLEDECNPHTLRHLDRIVRWLAERVGLTRHVLGADVDPR